MLGYRPLQSAEQALCFEQHVHQADGDQNHHHAPVVLVPTSFGAALVVRPPTTGNQQRLQADTPLWTSIEAVSTGLPSSAHESGTRSLGMREQEVLVSCPDHTPTAKEEHACTGAMITRGQHPRHHR